MMVAVAGWINRQQQDVIEYLQEEVRVLKELQGQKRLRFSDDQRKPAYSEGEDARLVLTQGGCGDFAAGLPSIISCMVIYFPERSVTYKSCC